MLTNGDILNFDLCSSKVGQIKNLGITSCILIKYNHDKNLELIQPLVQEYSTYGWFSKMATLRTTTTDNK
jgi:hypothetical protein